MFSRFSGFMGALIVRRVRGVGVGILGDFSFLVDRDFLGQRDRAGEFCNDGVKGRCSFGLW
jgi:hypothetical protein